MGFVSPGATSPLLSRAIPIAALAVAILVPTSSAGAQSAADQYVPQLDRGGVSEEAAGGASSGGGAPAATAGGLGSDPGEAPSETQDAGAAGGGEIPGTGFPVTPFVAVLAGALLILLAARFVLPALSRR